MNTFQAICRLICKPFVLDVKTVLLTANHRSSNDGGICRCSRCFDNQPCGHYALCHHLRFYRFVDSSAIPVSSNPKIVSLPPKVLIATKTRYDLPNTPKAVPDLVQSI